MSCSAIDNPFCFDFSTICLNRLNHSITGVDGCYFRKRMDLNTSTIATARIPPDNRIMPDDATRRMMQSGHDRIMRIGIEANSGNELFNFVRENKTTIDSKNLIHLCTLAKTCYASIRVG